MVRLTGKQAVFLGHIRRIDDALRVAGKLTQNAVEGKGVEGGFDPSLREIFELSKLLDNLQGWRIYTYELLKLGRKHPDELLSDNVDKSLIK